MFNINDFQFSLTPCRYKGNFPSRETDQFQVTVTNLSGKTFSDRFWCYKGTPENQLVPIFLSQLAHKLPDPDAPGLEEYGDWEDDFDIALDRKHVSKSLILKDKIEEFFGVPFEEFITTAEYLYDEVTREPLKP